MEKYDMRGKDSYEESRLAFNKPVLGIVANSGTGKTSLLVKLLPLMKLQGLRVAVIKSTHHDFEIDKPGKDSFRLREAGADQMLLASQQRYALISENEVPVEPNLGDLVSRLDLENIDLVLVEGFKYEAYAKIELHRYAHRRTNAEDDFIFQRDKNVVAVASDTSVETGELPLLNINVPEEIAGFINRWLKIQDNSHVKRCA